MMHSWKWKNNKIAEAPMSTATNEEKIKTVSVRNSEKTLGVYVSPSLSWKDEFEYTKQKLRCLLQN